jgi:hypothetical protein
MQVAQLALFKIINIAYWLDEIIIIENDDFEANKHNIRSNFGCFNINI